MTGSTINAEQSVETLQAYLLAYMQSRSEDERLGFAARLQREDGLMAAAVELLHATHDAMVVCLREPDEETSARMALLVQSPNLFDSDLASLACYTLSKFSRAIVMDLGDEEVPPARLRLQGLVIAVQERAVGIKLH